MEKKDSRSDHVEPLSALLALLVVWMVAGACLCLENTAGIPARLAYALVGIVIMVLMCRTASKGPLPEVKKLDVSVVGEGERAEREHAAELAARERAAELACSKVAKAQRKAGLRCPSCGSCDVTLIRDTGRTLSVGKAVVGAALAGTPGAIIGATMGKKGKREYLCNSCGRRYRVR